jgi:hypothetical protein
MKYLLLLFTAGVLVFSLAACGSYGGSGSGSGTTSSSARPGY